MRTEAVELARRMLMADPSLPRTALRPSPNSAEAKIGSVPTSTSPAGANLPITLERTAAKVGEVAGAGHQVPTHLTRHDPALVQTEQALLAELEEPLNQGLRIAVIGVGWAARMSVSANMRRRTSSAERPSKRLIGSDVRR